MSYSALYEGTVRHRRMAVRAREFRYGIHMAYVDLDELPELLGGRLASPRPGIVRFRRADYFGDPRKDLATAVRDGVAGADRHPAGGAGAPAHQPARVRPLLQPGELLLLLRPARASAWRLCLPT